MTVVHETTNLAASNWFFPKYTSFFTMEFYIEKRLSPISYFDLSRALALSSVIKIDSCSHWLEACIVEGNTLCHNRWGWQCRKKPFNQFNGSAPSGKTRVRKLKTSASFTFSVLRMRATMGSFLPDDLYSGTPGQCAPKLWMVYVYKEPFKIYRIWLHWTIPACHISIYVEIFYFVV